MGWFSRGRRRSRRYGRKVKRAYDRHSERSRHPYHRWKRNPTRKKYSRKIRRANKKYKGVGWTPDYLLSPIDAVPYVGTANKAYRAQKYGRRGVKTAVRTTKAGYRYAKSRRGGRSKSSPKGRVKRRGKYYYYRGKRVYRR